MGQEETRRLLSETASFLLLVGGGICVILAIGMPEFLEILYPNFISPSSEATFVALSRLLLVQPILLGLSGVIGSVAQVHRRFVLFALSPVLYNVGIIIGVAVFYPRWGLLGIGVGVVLGAVAYLAVNIPVLVQTGLVPRLCLPEMRRMVSVMRDSLPRSLALGVGSVTALALTAIASRLGTGVVSVLTFASNLEAVPLALIGSSYAVAAFPALSEASALQKRNEFTAVLSASARHIILWSMVALGLIVVLRAHIVRVILGTGAFDWNATRLTAALLAVLSIGLAAQGLVLLFSRALYAARQSWRPLGYQILAGILTVVLAWSFLRAATGETLGVIARLLRVADVPGTAVLLVAFATTLGQLALVALSLVALRNVTPGLATMLGRSLRDGGLSALLGAGAAYGVLAIEGGLAPLTTLAAVCIQGTIAGVVGLAVAGLTLFFVENEEFRIVSGALSKLLRLSGPSTAVLSPSAEEHALP
jgi:putative peptidoglycan lipid II flippase